MEKNLEQIREDKINELVERCIKSVEKYSIFTIKNTEYTSLTYKDFIRVCAILEKDGKYNCVQVQSEMTWNVRKNPNYETNESVKRTNEALIISASNQQRNDDRTFSVLALTAIASLISLGVSIQDIACNSTQKEFQEQVQSLKRIDSTLLKLVEKEEIKKGDTLNVSLIEGLSHRITPPKSK